MSGPSKSEGQDDPTNQKPLSVDTKSQENQEPKSPELPKEEKSSHQGLNKILNAFRGYYDEAVDGFRDAKSRLEVEPVESAQDPVPPPPPAVPTVAREYRPEPKMLNRQAQVTPSEAESFSADSSGSPALRPMQTKETGFRYRSVLVIGGMDFLGAALVNQLNLGGIEEIIVSDSLNESTSEALPFLRFQEFLDPSELEELAASNLKGLPAFSHIFHVGGWQPATMTFSKNLYAAALKAGTRFVAISSASSLGPRPVSALPEPWSLPTTFRPQSLEGVVSTLFDRYALPKSVNKSYLSLKHYRLFGPGERMDEGVYGIIKSCYQQICSNGSVRLPAALQPGTPEGDRGHDFCYVLDAARTAARLGQSPQSSGIYELGSGSSCTAAALAESVFAVLGVPPSISWDPSLPFTPPSAEPEAAFVHRLREAGIPASTQELTASVGHYITTYLQTGLTIGEDLESPEPSPAPAVEIKTPILLPRKKLRVAS